MEKIIALFNLLFCALTSLEKREWLKPLLGFQNAKTIKGESLGFRTGILYLSPSKFLCPFSSIGCRLSCLFTAGRASVYPMIIRARMGKTRKLKLHSQLFMAKLAREIYSLVQHCQKAGLKPCIRLNGTSDINWNEKEYRLFGKSIFQLFSSVQFYDYTKDLRKVLANKVSNYYLVFSRTESNWHDCLRVLKSGKNVAVVFAGKTLPKTWEGFPVINGDAHDLRFLDNEQGVIVGLSAKGKARKDSTGFVVREY